MSTFCKLKSTQLCYRTSSRPKKETKNQEK